MRPEQSDITDLEHYRLNAREGCRLPRDRIPHCYAKHWSCNRAQCNHLAPTKNPVQICEVRRSCLIDYASRLGINVDTELMQPTSFGDLVKRVKEEEARLGCSNEIKPTAPPAPKYTRSQTIRSIVTDFLSSKGAEGACKKDIYAHVGTVRGRETTAATAHQIDVLMQAKAQEKFGYKITKYQNEERVWFFCLTGAEAAGACTTDPEEIDDGETEEGEILADSES